MNYVARQNGLCAVHHEEWCVFGGAVRRGPQPPEYGVELLYLVRVRFLRDRTNLGLMPLIIRPFALSTWALVCG